MKLSEVSQAKVSLAGASALKNFFDTLQEDETGEEELNNWILRLGFAVDPVDNPPEVIIHVSTDPTGTYKVTIQSIVNDLDAIQVNSSGEFVNYHGAEIYSDSPVWVVFTFKLPPEAAIEAAIADLSTSDGIYQTWRNIMRAGEKLAPPKHLSTTTFGATNEYRELMASLDDDYPAEH